MSSEAANDHEHEHDGSDASSDGDWPSISHHPVGELIVGFNQQDETESEGQLAGED